MRWLLGLLPLTLLVACSPESSPAEAPAAATATPNDAQPAVQAAHFNEETASRPADEKATRELNSLLVQLGHAARSLDGAEGVKLIDFHVMISVLQSSSGLEFPDMETRNAFTGAMQSSAQQWFSGAVSPFRWQRASVRKAAVSESGNMAVCFVRAEIDDEGSLGKMRFWMVRHDDGWRVFDWENLNLGIRTTRTMAALVPQKVPGSDRWAYGVSLLTRGWALVDQGDYDRAFQSLSIAGRGRLPSDLEATRRALLGLCLEVQGQPERAMEEVQAALALRPDFPDARFTRGRALMSLMRHEEALKDFEYYIETLGSDPIAWVQVGNCLTWLDRNEDALKAFIAGVEDLPTVDGLIGLAVCLPPGQASRLAPYFRALRNQAANYPALIEDLWDNRGLLEHAQVINAEFKKTNPENNTLAWYEADIAVHEGRYADAAALLKAAQDRGLGSTDVVRFRDTYRWCMVRAGKAVDLLLEEKRSQWMFNHLAEALSDEDDAEALENLCEAWREGNEGKSLLHYWLGVAAYMQGEYAAAETRYAQARKLNNMPKEQADDLHSGLVRSMAQQGNWLEAYRNVKPTPATFMHLADWAFLGDNSEALSRLIDMRSRETTADTYLPRARGDLAWLKQEYKSAATELSVYIAREGKKRNLPWHVHARCVRALLRSGQPAVAESQARNLWVDGRATEDDYMLAVVYAATDQAAKLLASLRKLDDTAHFMVMRLYADEDAGGRLRGEAFTELHKQFPPPPEKPTTD